MVSQRLKNARNRLKLTQEALAEKVNTTKGTISNYENGHSTPSNDMLVLLSDVLEITTDYLLGKSENPKGTSKADGLSSKDEKDIAKRMEKMKKDLIEGNSDGEALNYMGEPMSEEAIESLLEAIEHAERIATLANKKYAPNKYKDKDKGES